jgi:hypothetical protein
MFHLGVLQKQFTRGILAHGYLFWGSDEDSKNRSIDFLGKNLIGHDYRLSPDYYELDQLSYSIDEMRKLKEKAFLTPFVAESKLIVIRNIELLRWDAVPVLLKIFEEPNSSTIFVATTKSRSSVLPTIRSRLSNLRFWSPVGLSISKEEEEKFQMYKKLPYSKRFEIVRKLSNEELKEIVVSGLSHGEKDLHKNIFHEQLIKMEHLLTAYNMLGNPTIGKRTLGEYIMMNI